MHILPWSNCTRRHSHSRVRCHSRYNRPHPGHYHGRSHTRDDRRYVHHTHTAIHTRLLGQWFSFIGGSSPCRERERRERGWEGKEWGGGRRTGRGGGKGGGGMGSEGIVTHKVEGTVRKTQQVTHHMCKKCLYIHIHVHCIYKI